MGDIEKWAKMPSFRWKKRVFLLKARRNNKEQKTKQNKPNKEGLGPSELALRATSPDP